ncbi:MAG: PID-CTERM protein-sorting domain-containing protein [Aquaticitalea sp.]
MGLQNKKILASILFVLISFVSVAQGGQPPPPMPPPPPGLPIDNWVYGLFVVALIYGIFKKFKFSKA